MRAETMKRQSLQACRRDSVNGYRAYRNATARTLAATEASENLLAVRPTRTDQCVQIACRLHGNPHERRVARQRAKIHDRDAHSIIWLTVSDPSIVGDLQILGARNAVGPEKGHTPVSRVRSFPAVAACGRNADHSSS